MLRSDCMSLGLLAVGNAVYCEAFLLIWLRGFCLFACFLNSSEDKESSEGMGI